MHDALVAAALALGGSALAVRALRWRAIDAAQILRIGDSSRALESALVVAAGACVLGVAFGALSAAYCGQVVSFGMALVFPSVALWYLRRNSAVRHGVSALAATLAASPFGPAPSFVHVVLGDFLTSLARPLATSLPGSAHVVSAVATAAVVAAFAIRLSQCAAEWRALRRHRSLLNAAKYFCGILSAILTYATTSIMVAWASLLYATIAAYWDIHMDWTASRVWRDATGPQRSVLILSAVLNTLLRLSCLIQVLAAPQVEVMRRVLWLYHRLVSADVTAPSPLVI